MANMEDGLDCQGPFDFNWISTEDSGQGYAKVEFSAPTPPSKVEAYASNESPMSNYYRFMQMVLSFPPMEGVDLDFDIGIENVMIVVSLMDHTIGMFCIVIIHYGII